jgi:hypothetical protein
MSGRSRRLRNRVIAGGAATTVVLGFALLAAPGAALAAGTFDPSHADVGGTAYGAAGSVTVNLPPTPKSVIKVPQLALEQVQYCAMPVDGQTYETTLASTALQTAPDPSRLILGINAIDDKGVIAVNDTTVGVTESSKTTGLNALAGQVTATLLYAVAHTTATAAGINNHNLSGDATPTGVTVSNLNIFGHTFNGNVPANTRINLGGSSFVVINQQLPDATGITVNGIHLHLAAFRGFTGDLVIAHAYTRINTAATARFSGLAYAAWLKAKVNSTTVDTGKLGLVGTPCIEGHAHTVIAAISKALPGGGTFLNTGAGTADTVASPSPNPNVTSSEDLQSANLLNGLITADSMHVQASLNAVANVVGGSASTQFVNLVVNGNPIGSNPAPNTRIDLPGLGYVVINEQYCQGGTPAACSATNSNFMSVNALHLHVTTSTNSFHLNVGADLRLAAAQAGISL